jgi:hypothetical protein
MTELVHPLDDSRCADLVLGLLSPAERERLLAHARSCSVCARRLQSHVSAFEAARPGPSSRHRTRARTLPAWAWLPAAAAIVLVSVILWPRPHVAVTTASPHWLPVPAEGVLLREGQAEDPHLAAGFAAYARHDLVSAARELEAARTQDAGEQARRLYLAHVRLLQGRSGESLALLRSLTWSMLPGAVQRDGVALLARALRATGDAAAADSLEHALATTPEWVPVQP